MTNPPEILKADPSAGQSVSSRIPAVRPPGKDYRRVYELDLLRFIAAFSVLLYHYGFRGAARDNFTTFSYPAIASFARYGYLGVGLFFVISGFVISMSAASASPGRFVISRVVRLYPAFWVCCTITFLVTILVGGARFSATTGQYLINLTMLNGFLNVPGIDGAYWTLMIELQFYWLVFLLLVFRKFHRLNIFLGVWLMMVIIIRCHWAGYSHIFRPPDFVVSSLPPATKRWVEGFFMMPDYAAYFIAGATFFLAYSEGWTRYRIGLIAFSYWLTMWDVAVGADQQSLSPLVAAACVSVFFVVFGLITGGKLSAFGSPKLVFLGAITYPLYLLHQFVGYMIFNLFTPGWNRHLLFWGVTATMILAAYAINIRVEKRYAKRLRLFLTRAFPGYFSSVRAPAAKF